MRGDPPRHIRDIAHLYLSRMQREGEVGVRVAVAGVSADVIPAFHVANLALAAAARGIPVGIHEHSGLPVNAGCFLGLHPRCWLGQRGAAAPRVTAFARVTFGMGPESGSSARPGDGIEVVHVPPWDAGTVHAGAVARARPAVLVYLAESDAGPRPWRERDAVHGVVRRVAFVTRAAPHGDEGACLGNFTRWTRFLADPVPAVLRDPASRLARQYTDALSQLLAVASSAAHTQFLPPHAAANFEPR